MARKTRESIISDLRTKLAEITELGVVSMERLHPSDVTTARHQSLVPFHERLAGGSTLDWSRPGDRAMTFLHTVTVTQSTDTAELELFRMVELVEAKVLTMNPGFDFSVRVSGVRYPDVLDPERAAAEIDLEVGQITET